MEPKSGLLNAGTDSKYSLFLLFFQCVPIYGRGFAVGSYRCVCRKGYYYPKVKGDNKDYFNGTEIEEDISNNNGTKYNKPGLYECLLCRKGCETCVDNSPCIVELNMWLRWSLLCFTVVCIISVSVIGGFVWVHRELKVR